jgi:hypothetical protein
MIKATTILVLSSAAMATLVFALVSFAQPPCVVDSDGDLACDEDADNCLGIYNPTQRDDDEDGYGNSCDLDVDQNCIAGAPDVSAVLNPPDTFAPWVPSSAGAYDVDQNGAVNGSDVIIVQRGSYSWPGPSGRICADCTAAPAAALGMGVCP